MPTEAALFRAISQAKPLSAGQILSLGRLRGLLLRYALIGIGASLALRLLAMLCGIRVRIRLVVVTLFVGVVMLVSMTM